MVLLTTACSPGAQTAEAYSVTDSAGITIVENQSPQWTSDSWTIAEDPEWVFGKDGMSQDGIPLQRVSWIRPMSRGRFAILDRAVKEVFVIDGAAQLLETLGGDGDGPGELRRPSSLHACGDTLLITNRPRIDQFVTGVGYVGQLSGDSLPSRGFVQGASSDCNLLQFSDPFAQRSSLTVGDTRPLITPLYWFDRAADRLAPLYMDSMFGVRVGGYPGDNFPVPQLPPWIALESSAVSDTLIIQGIGRRPELRWRAPGGGTIKILRWAQDPAPVTEEDKEEYEEKRRLYLKDYGTEPGILFFFRPIAWYPALPSVKPYFDEVQVDETDHVWILKNPATMGDWDQFRPTPEPQPQRWLVFDPSGRWLGEVTMPANFALHAVADGKAVGVMKDEFDVQTVRAYRIERH